jgi:hypothetical protein
MMDNSEKIILDLCGGTGSWSKPSKEAGYDVRLVTLPDQDVRYYKPPKGVYGILAAPPCTHFSSSGAQFWMLKDADNRTIDGMGIVIACLKIIAITQPVFWVLENPIGKLSRWMGKSNLIFSPCDFGDAYTKKTCLWGNFNIPPKNPVEPEFVMSGNYVRADGTKGKKYSLTHMKIKDASIRSITPPGFARAFYEANK